MNRKIPWRDPGSVAALEATLAERIMVLDGAMGTMIQQHELTEADYRGQRFADHPLPQRGNNDLLTLTRPGAIAGIHRAFLGRRQPRLQLIDALLEQLQLLAQGIGFR